MSTKTGFLIGFGAGYVLGAKAGRQRYEQIRTYWGQLMGSPTVQRATERTKEVAGEGAKRSLYTVQRGVEKAGSAVRERLHKDNDPTDRIVDRLEDQAGTPPEENTPPGVREAFGPDA
jgi:hypothetical protein